ncbi:tetratricopeptide repeat-containing sensor histidine kinase [Flavobacterium microcysteis]|uniref:Tetratricopeptide repeat protein n=1 Tax=Flavobacterium microcysteis TaxID=2596891 RepID=A0A501PZX0_9FLAO|nr:tetratricopeptide repeat protein [Flavobacterium microcysteis]TPD65296.1 tetratricopeptide repeat protein [Flavobacterium microcysteis]
MKKTVFLFLGVLLLLSCSKKKLDYSEKGTDSIPIYLVLANEDSLPYLKRQEYNKKAFDVFIRQENDSMNRINLFKIANRYYNMGNMEEYKKTTDIILKKAIDYNDTISMTKAYSYLGDYYTNSLRRDSAFLYYTKAEKNYQKKNDKINLGGVYINIATAQAYENDFFGSELSAIKALDILKDTKEKHKIYEAYNLLGIISNELKNYEKALEYHTKALSLTDNNDVNRFYEKESSLNNIGNVYQSNAKYGLAIKNYKEALQNKSLIIGRPNLYALLLDNLAYSKLKIRDNSKLPDLFYESLKISESLKLKNDIVYIKIHLSEFYWAKKDTLTAQKFGNEALLFSRNIKNYSALLSSLKQLAVVDPLKAAMYKQEYIKLNDSLRLEEKKIREKFARIRYEADEITLEKDKAIFQKWTVFWIAVSVLLCGLVVYVFRLRKFRQRAFFLLISRQKADEEINRLMLEHHRKFEQGREKEKKRIARELQDEVVDKLFNIRTSLLVLENKTDSETIRHCISQMAEIQDVEREIRDIAHGLGRNDKSLQRGYPELLKYEIVGFANKIPLKINMEIDKAVNWDTLDSRKKLGLYQILQECLRALGKQETDVTVRFYKDNSLLVMEVNDIGFDARSLEKEQDFKGIELGAKRMGADLRISNILDGKTSIKMTMLIKTDQNF